LLTSTNGGQTTNCNSGTATVTGTMSGQSVNLTATIGSLDQNGNPSSQTIALSGGALSANNSSIQNGMYTVTPGYAYVDVNGQSTLLPCGTAQDAGTWSATLVPPLTGGFQGFFHSTIGAGFANQNFPVSGTFTQGPNIGAASASVTGTLLFQDPVTLLNNYPCLSTASVNGTISGNSVLLQIFSTNGTPVGQIGQTPGSANPPTAVTLNSTQSGYVVQNLTGATAGNNGGGYAVTTKSCSTGDAGNLCLALGGSKACNQPITLTPFSLSFTPQLLGSAPTTQTITLTNNSSSALSGLKLLFTEQDSLLFYSSGGGDFNGVHNFTEQDNCTQQGSITLNSGASCPITVFFSPQESCPWLPQPQGGASIDGLPPAKCPLPLTASLTVTVPSGSVDADSEFSVPVTGTGLSLVVPSGPEIDFGWEAFGEASPPQTLTFTNQGPSPVTILPAGAPCVYGQLLALPRPPVSNGQPMVPGIQLAETAGVVSSPIVPQSNTSPPLVNAPTADFFCESDPPRSNGGSGLPNLQISKNECSGQTLARFGQQGNSCSLQVSFVPQPATSAAALTSGLGLDDFLELNSMWCGDPNNPPEPSCEIDSGRFPVEIKTNPPSPLRMSPSAGMDFGTVPKGTGTNPLTITIFNDPVDPKAGPVSFTSKLVTNTDYLESDNCPPILDSDQSCTVTVTFAPTVVGPDQGQITLTYSLTTGSGSSQTTQFGLVQTIYLRGIGQ
ncbi:MAG: choice-of-anchor D domain-containing protein, partial [Candidatus Sulfotelmatobacter sp.]